MNPKFTGFIRIGISDWFWIGCGLIRIENLLWGLSELLGLVRNQILEWLGIVRIDSEWISIRNFRQGEPIWCLKNFLNSQRSYAVVFLKDMCSGALNHLAKARSLSFVFFCVRLLILVGSALTFKVNVEQVSKLITLAHDVRLGYLVMGLPFGFLFKMGEI